MAITYDAPSDTISTDITCTFTDIYDADQAGGWGKFHKQGDNAFLCECKLKILSGGTVNSEKEFCEFTKGVTETLRVDSGGELRTGKLSSNVPCQGSTLKFNPAVSYVFRTYGTFKFYASCLIFEGGTGQPLLRLGSTSDIRRSRCESNFNEARQFCYFTSTLISIDGLQIMGGSMSLGFTATPASASNIHISGAQADKIAIAVFYANDVTIENAEIDDEFTRILSLWVPSGVGKLHLKNAILNLNKITYDCGEVDEHIYIEFTFDPIVTDVDGNPLTGASIKMEEKIGAGSWSELWTKTTGADGKLTDGAQTMIYKYVNQDVETTHYHRITVTKAGYGDYGPVEITIDHKIEDDQIVLGAYKIDDIMTEIKKHDQKIVGLVA